MQNIIKFLLPNEIKFFVMLENQSKHLLKCGEFFGDYIDHYNDLTLKQREEQQKKMKELEEIGDRITHHIIEQIDRNFITPFDREDIHELTGLLDDVLDSMDVVCKRITLYELKQTDEAIMELKSLILDSVKQIDLAISDLRKLKDIKEHCVRLIMLEGQADRVLAVSLKKLFKCVKDPITLFKTKEIYEYMESVTDRSRSVARVLQSIVVKHG